MAARRGRGGRGGGGGHRQNGDWERPKGLVELGMGGLNEWVVWAWAGPGSGGGGGRSRE